MNSVAIVGNVTNDVELRTTDSGTSVVSFTVAVNEKYKEKENTYWIDCVAWSGIAETISKYFHKGDRVGIEGKLTTRTWEGRNGKVKATEVVVSNITFLSAKPKSTTQEAERPIEIADADEDLPFE
jgi:single-strand DNA-binding protein